MGDSATDLWDSELLRTRHWLAAQYRDDQQEHAQRFKRVNDHISFKDHQRSLQSDAAASEEEDDDHLALEFLGDVEASDMTTLLQAEAAKLAASVPPVEIGPPLETRMATPAELMQPLAMPTNLASPTLKPKTKAVPMSQLDPKPVRTGSATLGNDAAVRELMQDLQLDVTQLQSDGEETKTEESTPPHLLKDFGGNSKGVNGGVEQTGKAAAGSTQSKYMQQVSLKSPQDPHKKVAVQAATKTDDVGDEMSSWVSGYRDPEVIRRKENLRRKRKHIHRFGMSSEEEQRQVLRRVKQITNDSDSESEDDFSSDYSPAEEEEVPEPDEPEVVDLLSDDYLDSDEDKKPVKRRRKRLRQGSATQQKKKSRSRKPAVTRRLSQQVSTNEAPLQSEKTPEAQAPVVSAAIEANDVVASTKNVPMEVSDEDAGDSNQPIEFLSSEDEAGGSDKSSAPTTANGTPEKMVESDATKGSTILRLKIPEGFRSPQTLQGASHNTQQVQTNHANADKAPSKLSGRTDNSAAVADTLSGVASHQSASDEQRAKDYDQPGNEETIQQFADANDDDADLSDTGTVDLEGENLSVENEESNTGAEVTSTGELAGNDAGAPREEVAENVDNVLKNSDSKTSGEDGEMEDEDVSEAETEILEDDEPDTDDLGLQYSDDSDADDKPVDSKKNDTGDQMNSSSDKKDGATSVRNTQEDGNGDGTGKSMNVKSGDKAVDSSTAGVQQFFDLKPLKLKPKAKTTTTTSPKPLPVHDYADTHLKKGNNNAKKATLETKQTPSPEKPSVGSNGLRPSKKPIATSTVMKGKFAVTRRSTKMLEPEDTPGAKRPHKSQYTMVPTKKSNGSSVMKDLDDVPLTMLTRELSKKTEDSSSAKYLSYAGAKKTEDAPSYAVEAPRNVPRSRFGGDSEPNASSSTAQNSSSAANGQSSQVNDKIASRDGYRQERQISIYDALHMDGQESASDIREGTGYKRPSRFKKMQEEAARNGTPMVKSRLQATDLDKLPIPKKNRMQAPQRTVSSSRDRDRDPRANRRSSSPDNRDPSKNKGIDKPSDLPELGEVCQNGKIDGSDRFSKKQKTSHHADAPPSPGALATFDDDNMFISDSDDDGNILVEEVEDIRFDLDSVPVNEALMMRQVYVTGVNPTVCAEQIEEDFTGFGVAVDRDTGFPAIAVFPSQRTHLGRGDACVTFETEEGAQEAVEELNSKNVKNSMIGVRRMDAHTQRILTVQFETCDKCGRKRVFGPSNIKIGAESWLCSICFTANDSFATRCHGCTEALPEVDRSSFYSS
ncbi:hypothetical protein PF010_g4252 [Phytophthora fragariae]|uniref:RRM domain-containing protein n=1 Tax=Phytophthora fragariae TaxID=53985 RepID=A0A6G0LRT4_9STRA|nr:hypothetical protein PF010_g4252 [Phytophthora fragariae]